jgi:hypothetical protein
MSSPRPKAKSKSRKGKELIIYEVWRNTPCGDVSMGLFFTLKGAEKEAKQWNDTHTHPWDRATIIERLVQK